jgi:hypothetical protein
LSRQLPHEAGTTGEPDQGEAPGGREPGVPPAAKRGWRIWVLIFGVFLIPSVLYLALLVVPFLSLTTAQKLWVASGLVIAAEGTFLLSALILGREVVHHYRRFFDPRSWFCNKPR